MKKDQGNITDDLLVKYLLRETSAAEDRQVQEWVKESRENKDHLDQLGLIWYQSKTLAVTGGTSAGEAWEQFRSRLKKPATEISMSRRSYGWVRVAALLVLLAGAGTIGWFATRQNTPAFTSKVEAPAKKESAAQPTVTPTNTPAPETANNGTQQDAENTAVAAKEKPTVAKCSEKGSARDTQKSSVDAVYSQYRTNDFVCNGTPCPLEICIIQTINCPGSKPSAIATCSTLMPDRSNQVKYKAPGKIDENCSVKVKQITIKRVTTGETIVLDEHSQPAAEEVFNYITGRKKGNILAGMFHADCNNNDHEHTLKLDNNFGNLVLQ